MAAGDNVNDYSSVANGAYMNIQPGAGAVWQIFNLYFGDDWELYLSDGTNNIMIDSGTDAGALQKRSMVVTNTQYLRIKNVSGSSDYFGYDGVIWK